MIDDLYDFVIKRLGLNLRIQLGKRIADMIHIRVMKLKKELVQLDVVLARTYSFDIGIFMDLIGNHENQFDFRTSHVSIDTKVFDRTK
jgi:hypothetical protein